MSHEGNSLGQADIKLVTQRGKFAENTMYTHAKLQRAQWYTWHKKGGGQTISCMSDQANDFSVICAISVELIVHLH